MEPHQKLTILLLVTDLDSPTGGVQRNSRLLIRELTKRGHTVRVIARNYHGRATAETVDGASVVRTRAVGIPGATAVAYLLYCVRYLLRHRGEIDVVHCQQLFGPAMAAAVAKLFIHTPAVVRITLSGPTGEAAAVRGMPFAGIRLRLLNRIDRWIALTSEMKDELRSIGVSEGKIAVIPNSTQLPDLGARAEIRGKIRDQLSLDDGAQLGIFVGRLSEEKNVDILISAWPTVIEQCPSAHLLLVGDGSLYRNAESQLRSQAASGAASRNIVFLGHRDDVKDLLLASDAFLLPTSAEGMSNALVEAFACGLPVVATDIPANQEICRNGENSILVPVRDEQATAKAIIDVLSDRGLAERIGRSAREFAEANLTVDRMIDSYIDVYCDAVASMR